MKERCEIRVVPDHGELKQLTAVETTRLTPCVCGRLDT